MIRSDFHVHTVYSDGAHALREMIETALERGFTVLGFSDHAYMAEGQDWCMSRENTARYREELAALREQYRGRLELLCGIEQDYYSPDPTDGFDYVIGSVHEIHKDGQIFEIDNSLPAFEQTLAAYGDAYAVVEDYYGLVAKLPPCTIIGHLDLVTKFQQQKPLFDEEHPRYREAASAAVRALIPRGVPFEVNVGAMSRGYRTTPYPAPWLLQYICEQGGEVIVTGDCHDKNYLGAGFDTALSLVRACGFRRVVTFTADGKEYIRL